MLLSVFVLCGLLGFQSGEVIDVPKLNSGVSLDDFAGMKPSGDIAPRMKKITGFIQREPEDGKPATQRTEVYISHTGKYLYVVFLAFETDPKQIRARMVPREDINADDTLNILVDTYKDQRRAYMFRTNPLGIQWDGLWSEISGFDESFNTVWRSDGRLTDQGYMVLMAIPFKSVRSAGGSTQEWGVMFNRDITHADEQTYWPQYTNRIQGRLNQAATLRISGIDTNNRNYQLVPYATGRSFEVLDEDEARFIDEDFEGDIGLDAKLVINDNWVLDVAANPDFSQVESDNPQITTNERFEVFFEERRPFFLENADIFGGPINLVFTRRIADPSAGVRLTGKAGKFNVGTFIADDEAPGKVLDEGQEGAGDRALIGVVRLTRDVLTRSRVGFTYTGREFAGDWNHVYSLDGRFVLDDYWNLNGQIVQSSTDTSDGDTKEGHLGTIFLNREGRALGTHFHYSDTHEDFQTRLGFLRRSVQRPGLSNFHTRNRYTFWQQNSRLINWEPSFNYNWGWDRNTDEMLDEDGGVDVEFRWVGNLAMEVSYNFSTTKVGPDDYAILTDFLELDSSNVNVEFESEASKVLSWEVAVAVGDEVNFNPAEGLEPFVADGVQASGELSYRPIPPLRADLTWLYIRLEDKESGDQVFEDNIFRGRVNWQFTRELSMRMIFQYDDLEANPLYTTINRNRNLNADVLLTYLVNPWTALYVGYNSNWRNIALIDDEMGRRVILTDSDLEKDGNQLFLKFSYLL